jgi:hypothetical protein
VGRRRPNLLFIQAMEDGVLVLVEGLALKPHTLRKIPQLCEFGEFVTPVDVLCSRIVLVGDDQGEVGDGALDEEGGEVTEESHEDSLPNIVSEDVTKPHGLLREGREG